MSDHDFEKLVTKDFCQLQHYSNNKSLECIEKKLDSIIETINGNGSKGIKERLTILEEAKKTIEMNDEKNENRFWNVVRPVIPYVVFGSIWGILYGLQNMFK